MNLKKLFIEFVTMFAVTLATAVLVTSLWRRIGDGKSSVDWETSFTLAVLFGIILTWTKSREIKAR